jgi:DNA-binding winged helix-turn-helix (wHTH) protein/tetratricopeptide (TPR) repeat protein
MKAFGPFRLDTVNHCLWRADERALLTPKAFDVLRYLVEHSDRLVTQDELLEALWPETYVNPEGIRKYILEIRKVLGDRPDQPAFIGTFPKRGYQFVAPVTDQQSAASPVAAVVATDEAEGRMVGRGAALAQLDDHLAKALGGQRQIVFVTGEAGIGKTTLVDVFQHHIQRGSNLRIARGQCIEGFGGSEAYYPMLEALGSLLQDVNSPLIQLLAERAPTWLIQFPALVKPEQRESLQREILASTRQRMVREICEALELITLQTPLVVILEDLHWVDPSTLDLISALARRRESSKLLVVGTYRPVDVVLSQSPLKGLKQDLLVRKLCHEIAIECLEESDVAEYLANTFTAERIPSGFSSMIHQNSGGNPLFMVTLVEDMLNKGLIAKEQGRLILAAPLDEICPGMPETLQQMLEIQLERLSPEEQRILQTGSVAGEHFSVWAAAAMTEISPAAVEVTCDRLASRQQFIRSIGMRVAPDGAPSAHYEFRHALYRQALYRSLSGLNRSQLHLSLSERLMPICDSGKPELASELALHFEQGRDYTRAVRCLMLAAENAAQRFAHRDSIQILRHALELASTLAPEAKPGLEIQISQRIGDAHYTLGELSDAGVLYKAAADQAAEAGLTKARVGALLRLAAPAWFADATRGNEVCGQALEVSESVDDPLLAAQTRLAVSCFRLIYQFWRKEDAEACSRALETIRQLSGSSNPQNAYYIYVQAFQGQYEEAHRQGDALISATTNPRVYLLGSAALGVVLLLQGRFGEVLRTIRAERELAEKDGEDPWMWIFGDAWLRALCFDFDGARRVCETIMRSDAGPHASWTSTVSRISAGYKQLYQGNHDQALQCFAEVRDFQITPRFFLHWHWRMHAELGTIETWLSAGDVANARREVDGFLQSALAAADPNMQARAWEMRARVAWAEQDRDDARACIGNALEILDRFDIPVAAWHVHRTAWDVCRDEGDSERAAAHRAKAKQLVMSLVDSFEHSEPLRESLLTAAPVRRLFGEAASA